MAYSDRALLERLIECEAGGEGENGMKAVASVVMNRVTASGGESAREGQGSIRKLIMQPGLIVSASETERGAYNPQNIYNMRPTDVHYSIADWAMRATVRRGSGMRCGFSLPFRIPAARFFPRRAGCSACASATTASTTPRKPSTIHRRRNPRLRKEWSL